MPRTVSITLDLKSVRELRDSLTPFTGKGAFNIWIDFNKDVVDAIRLFYIHYTPVDTGYAAESWSEPKHNAKGEWEFYNTALSESGYPYVQKLDVGSIPGKPPWPRPKKRTVLAGPRIWSSQAVHGITYAVKRDAELDRIIGASVEKLFRKKFK